MQEATVTIYTHPDCHYSRMAVEDYRKLGIPFRQVDLSRHPEAWQEVERLTGGQRITPVIVEGDLVTVGYGGAG